MSYNYDFNPWDDNNPAQPAPNQYQTSSSYGAAAAEGYSDQYPTAATGYSNPAEQYAVQDAWNATGGEQQNQAENQQQEQLYQEQVGANDGGANGGDGARQESRLGQFLRAHVPLCGLCMDFTTPVLDTLLKYVNRDLLTSKLFYFFFYSAFGSLFPLMGVYFKQLGMNPAQVGVLTGVRPFIEIFSAPFWNSLAERFQKSKALLLFSLASWIVFTYSLAHIRPPASACIAFNDTNYVLYTPYSANDLSNYDVGQLESENSSTSGPEPAKENELFMGGMPANSAEKKDQILADEENVIDQGKRRRRKRSYYARPSEQIQRPSMWFSRNSDSMDANDVARDSDKLDTDLENDFEDTSLDSSVGPDDDDHRHVAFHSENSDSAEYRDELDQQTSFSTRSRRSLDYERGKSDEPSDESEPEKMDEHDERHGGRLKASDENDIEGGEESSEGNQQTEEPKHGHKQQSGDNNGKELDHQAGANPVGDAGLGVNKTRRVYKQRHKTPPTHIVGMSPITVEYAVNYNKDKHSQFVTPMFSTIVYKLDDIKEVFFLLLLLIALGEFFSAPALTIADNTTLNCLGKNTDLYGRQRMFGSIGWAITLFLVGMALDNSTKIADHPCGPHQRERSYTVCFTIFSLLMGCAFITATQFKFNYGPRSSGSNPGATNGADSQELVTKAVDGNTVITTTVGANNIDELYASTRPREIFNTAPPVNAPPPGGHQGGAREKFEFLDKWKSAVFAQSTWELPEWFGVFRQFQNTMHLTYLFITWFLGCGVGLVLTFLFWHLQDVGGTPTLFGICSIINHISEILAYFFSSFFIKRFGHTRVLSVGLGCNVIRFLYVAFLSNPYYALPFELVQGITHATCFAACCSYISHVSKPELKASTQGVMQGLHNGIGKACGALLGGYMINAIGSRASFCIYGLSSGCVLAGFLYVKKHNGG